MPVSHRRNLTRVSLKRGARNNYKRRNELVYCKSFSKEAVKSINLVEVNSPIREFRTATTVTIEGSYCTLTIDKRENLIKLLLTRFCEKICSGELLTVQFESEVWLMKG